MDPVDDHLPAPLWDPSINLGIFERVEIPHRFMSGPIFTDLSAEAHRALIKLLFFAWHQVPAGTLPNHNETLAENAGFGRDLAAWTSVGLEVLDPARGWELCADGRYYLADWGQTIEEAWGRRVKDKSSATRRQARARMRKDLEAIGVADPKRIDVAAIDAFIDKFRAAGGGDVKGAERARILTLMASDHGLLPKSFGDGDIVLASRFNPIRGGGRGP